MSSAGQSQEAGCVVLLMSNINECYFSLKGQSACVCVSLCVRVCDGLGGWLWVDECVCACVWMLFLKSPGYLSGQNATKTAMTAGASHTHTHTHTHYSTHTRTHAQEADVRTPWKFNTNGKESKEFVIKLTICWLHSPHLSILFVVVAFVFMLL